MGRAVVWALTHCGSDACTSACDRHLSRPSSRVSLISLLPFLHLADLTASASHVHTSYCASSCTSPARPACTSKHFWERRVTFTHLPHENFSRASRLIRTPCRLSKDQLGSPDVTSQLHLSGGGAAQPRRSAGSSRAVGMEGAVM